LSIEGRRRLLERCRARPIAHVAAEAGVSWACLSKWKNRGLVHELGSVGSGLRAALVKVKKSNEDADAHVVTAR
jgi:hypothetical protein